MARRAHPIRTRFVSESVEFRPIAAINTTPLIDMMLVILIMVIVAIPMRNHKVAVDLPAAHAQSAPPPPTHVLAIDRAGALAWDGQALPAAQLPGRLAALRADPTRPVLQLAPDADARYERFDEILAEIRRAGITRLGFVGNQVFAQGFDR